MSRILGTASRMVTQANRLGMVVAQIVLLSLAVVTTYGVVARYVFGRPSVHVFEISIYLLLIITWLSIGWCMTADRHVSMQALSSVMSTRWKRTAKIISMLSVMVFCGVIIWAGSNQVISSYVRGYRSATLLAFPLWIVYALVPIGAALLILSTVQRLFTSPSTDDQ
ncbi:TRAP transporter small permease [Pseudaminobacter arsenicus]|uniref:TRAP transporter small permease protein n=1 Tax=Borborobacter arsenicus TaxID=1851146 RepID=A0A432UZ09_9HYPH|nr:TRAP transporter small permease [Pseudaminobacter arsenicus]RUM95149.1 TRAP transporter small permease [Pseudaminobacter arsenicus]